MLRDLESSHLWKAIATPKYCLMELRFWTGYSLRKWHRIHHSTKTVRNCFVSLLQPRNKLQWIKIHIHIFSCSQTACVNNFLISYRGYTWHSALSFTKVSTGYEGIHPLAVSLMVAVCIKSASNQLSFTNLVSPESNLAQTFKATAQLVPDDRH